MPGCPSSSQSQGKSGSCGRSPSAGPTNTGLPGTSLRPMSSGVVKATTSRSEKRRSPPPTAEAASRPHSRPKACSSSRTHASTLGSAPPGGKGRASGGGGLPDEQGGARRGGEVPRGARPPPRGDGGIEGAGRGGSHEQDPAHPAAPYGVDGAASQSSTSARTV